MSNRSAHVAAGCISATAFYLSLVEVPDDPHHLVVMFGASYFGSRLPDLLEPATNPNHRAFLHSVVFLLLLVAAIKLLVDWKPKSEWERVGKVLLVAAGVGYVSHLVLDSLTPRGLPLIA